jgi:hypothetical protein
MRSASFKTALAPPCRLSSGPRDFDRRQNLGEPPLAIDVESILAVDSPAMLQSIAAPRDSDTALPIAIAFFDVEVAAILDRGYGGQIGKHSEVTTGIDAKLAVTALPSERQAARLVVGDARVMLQIGPREPRGRNRAALAVYG